MKIFSTFPNVKLNFWLVICIAKNFIWTTFKAISLNISIFLHPLVECTLDEGAGQHIEVGRDTCRSAHPQFHWFITQQSLLV